MLFSILKEKQQKAYRLKSYDDILLATLCSMFIYKGMAESINKHFIEQYRLLEGACAIWKNDGKFICSRVDFGGKPDENGIGTIAICATDNGTVKQFENWKENKEVAIIFNNNDGRNHAPTSPLYIPPMTASTNSVRVSVTIVPPTAKFTHRRRERP